MPFPCKQVERRFLYCSPVAAVTLLSPPAGVVPAGCSVTQNCFLPLCAIHVGDRRNVCLRSRPIRRALRGLPAHSGATQGQRHRERSPGCPGSAPASFRRCGTSAILVLLLPFFRRLFLGSISQFFGSDRGPSAFKACALYMYVVLVNQPAPKDVDSRGHSSYASLAENAGAKGRRTGGVRRAHTRIRSNATAVLSSEALNVLFRLWYCTTSLRRSHPAC